MNPIILYDDIFSKGSLASSATEDGYNLLNTKDKRAYTRWKAKYSGDNYIEHSVSNGSANVVAIAGHNLGTVGATLKVQIDTGGWTTLKTVNVNTNDPIMVTFNKHTSGSFGMQFAFSSLSPITPEVGVIYLGEYLEFPFPPDTVLQPFNQSFVPKFESVESGNLLGVENNFSPTSISHRFSNVERDPFLKDYLKFWNNHGKLLKPFFYARDLENNPDEVFYVRFSEKHVHSTPLSSLYYADSIQMNMVSI